MSDVKQLLTEQTQVTSPPKKTNWRDHLVAWVTSLVVTLFAFLSTIVSLISQILDSIADYLLPYLQQVPRHDRPLWIAIITFIAMGLVILNKRRLSGPNYAPPPMVPPPVANPTQPSAPAPQGQPLPPGEQPPPTPSAF
jgi:hypothetical protein